MKNLLSLAKAFLKTFLQTVIWGLVVCIIEILRLAFFPEASKLLSFAIFLVIFILFYWIKEKLTKKNERSLMFAELATTIHVVKEDIGNFKVFDAFLIHIEKTLVPMTVVELKNYILNRKGEMIDSEYLTCIEELLFEFNVTVLDGEDVPQGTVFAYITNRTK